LDEAKPGSASTTGYQRLCPKKSTTETAIARHKHIFIQEWQFLIGACRTCTFAVAISSSCEALLHTKLLPIILSRKRQLK
jgi:hypothetical protein